MILVHLFTFTSDTALLPENHPQSSLNQTPLLLLPPLRLVAPGVTPTARDTRGAPSEHAAVDVHRRRAVSERLLRSRPGGARPCGRGVSARPFLDQALDGACGEPSRSETFRIYLEHIMIYCQDSLEACFYRAR